jgi:hypothetical protein
LSEVLKKGANSDHQIAKEDKELQIGEWILGKLSMK